MRLPLPGRTFRPRGKSGLRVLVRFLPTLGRHWRLAVVAAVAMLVSISLQLPAPLLTKYLIDEVVAGHKYGELQLVGFGLLALLGLQSLFSFLQNLTLSRFRNKVLFDLRASLFKHLQSLPIRYFEKERTGTIISRLMTDVHRIRGLMASNIISSVRESLTLAFGMAALFWLHRKLALAALIPIPFYVFWLLHWGPKVRSVTHEMQQGYATLSGDLIESVTGIPVIKSFLAEGAELRKMLRSMTGTMNAEYRADKIEAWLTIGSGFISTGGKVAVIWIGCWEIMQGRLTLGAFLAFNSYLRFLFDPSRNLVSLNSTFQQSLAALERVYEIFDEEPEPADGCVAPPSGTRGKVEFRNVSFSYDGRMEAISQLSFVVEPGQTVGVVGPSGSGKSTIIKLLLRYYRPDSGQILLDDVDIQKLPLSWLRGQIATVFQQSFLFGEDVMSNVLVGRQDASMQDVVSCCRLAGAHEFVEELPGKYSTQVGERGVALSGGQVQRLSIARALLKRAPVLVLDEATASLDATAEKLFRETLQEQRRSITALIIAHRLSTVRQADFIIVIDAGRVIEWGRHEELIEREGCYRTLYEDSSQSLEKLSRAV